MSGDTISVLIADDHAMFAQTLATSLAAEPGIGVTAVVGSLGDAATVCAREHVDVVLLDHHLPDGWGSDAAADLIRDSPPRRVLLVSAGVARPDLLRALSRGASGYVSKAEPLATLIHAVRVAHDGGTFLDRETAMALATERSELHTMSALTPRELEVLTLLGDGFSTQDICDELTIGRNTLRNHVARILSKLDAHSKLEAVVEGRRRGLLRHTAPR